MILGSVIVIVTVITAAFVFSALDAISSSPEVIVDGVTLNGVTDKQMNDLMTPVVFLMIFVIICALTICVYGRREKER